MIKAVLFDLDGTLLPMDTDKFFKGYINSIKKMCVRCGFDPEATAQGILYGIKHMTQSDGVSTNEERFWQAFFKATGLPDTTDRADFIEFYNREFSETKQYTFPDPTAAECVRAAKRKNLQTVLATNPLFPKIGTQRRIEWAGFSEDDFEIVSTYEDYLHTKPDLDYYRAVLKKAGLKASECLMVGNDTDEDMCAAELGMDTFLVTDCLLNRNGRPIGEYRHGSLSDCLKYIEQL